MALEQIMMLKELGDIMAQKTQLEMEIKHLGIRERELVKLLDARPDERTRMTREKVANIRAEIISVLKDTRSNGRIWVPPAQVADKVAVNVPGAMYEEIMRQLRVLADDKESGVSHNDQRGRGSAYFYIGLE